MWGIAITARPRAPHIADGWKSMRWNEQSVIQFCSCIRLFGAPLFLKCDFLRQGWNICAFSYIFCLSPLRHRLVCFPERNAYSTTSVRTPLFPAPLPLWLINPLSIIWSRSITPFYRLSGGITISLSGAPLRMADPYQTEAMPWTKEPLWSSLHSATNVSISIGCCWLLLLLHDCLNRDEISQSAEEESDECGWYSSGWREWMTRP